jgi:hypothetical protein
MKQFSIRDLLFLFVIVALALGWWLDRRPIPARYQIQVVEAHAFVLDTATGQTWEKSFSPQGGGFTSPDFLDSKAVK